MIEIRQYRVVDLFGQENVRAGGRLLDVGAGAQKPFTSAFIGLGGNNHQVLTLDHNFGFENYRGDKIGLMLAGDALRLPFADDSFRWAALGWLLDVCRGDLRQVLSEVYRVLQNGGSLLGDVWLKSVPADINRVNEDTGRRLATEAKDYKQMISDAGFVVNDNLSFFGKRKGERGREISWCFVGHK